MWVKLKRYVKNENSFITGITLVKNPIAAYTATKLTVFHLQLHDKLPANIKEVT